MFMILIRLTLYRPIATKPEHLYYFYTVSVTYQCYNNGVMLTTEAIYYHQYTAYKV